MLRKLQQHNVLSCVHKLYIAHTHTLFADKFSCIFMPVYNRKMFQLLVYMHRLTLLVLLLCNLEVFLLDFFIVTMYVINPKFSLAFVVSQTFNFKN